MIGEDSGNLLSRITILEVGNSEMRGECQKAISTVKRWQDVVRVQLSLCPAWDPSIVEIIIDASLC